MAIALGSCALVGQAPKSLEPAGNPELALGTPTTSPSKTPFIQVTADPTINWPEQPVIIASGDTIVPLIAWLPNGELLFWRQQGEAGGLYWLSPQGRAVYLDLAVDGAPVNGAVMGHAALIEQVLPNSLQVRLTAPGGAIRTTRNLRIDKNLDDFPDKPALDVRNAGSLRAAAHYAGQALAYFACTAAQGAVGEVRLTFDWACSSQAARLAKATDLTQCPVMLEPLSSSLALVCPGSSKDAAPIPFGQCVVEMADWAASLATQAVQAQSQAERNAHSTAAVLALTPATEAVETMPGVVGTAYPTSTLGAPERLNAVSSAVSGTPTPVPTGAGVCGWLQALPGNWELDGDAVKGDLSEIEFFSGGSYQARLYNWPELLHGSASCLTDGTLKLTFRQGYLIASVNLAEDRLSLNVLTAIGYPASFQKETWRYNRLLE